MGGKTGAKGALTRAYTIDRVKTRGASAGERKKKDAIFRFSWILVAVQPAICCTSCTRIIGVFDRIRRGMLRFRDEAFGVGKIHCRFSTFNVVDCPSQDADTRRQLFYYHAYHLFDLTFQFRLRIIYPVV